MQQGGILRATLRALMNEAYSTRTVRQKGSARAARLLLHAVLPDVDLRVAAAGGDLRLAVGALPDLQAPPARTRRIVKLRGNA